MPAWGTHLVSGLRSAIPLRRAVALAALILLAAFSSGRADIPSPQGTPGAAVPAARQARKVAIITIDREIDAVMAGSVERRMKLAKAAGADAIVFDLNTPGGDLLATLAICHQIKASPIANTVAWIHPQAYSGGAIIALACREIVVDDPAVLGDAAIIQVNPFSPTGLNQLKETERQKMVGPLLSDIVDSARRRGYDERLVQGFVSRGVDLWMVQNTQTGKRLFVGEDEYETIMGEKPPKGTPRIPAASGAVPIQSEVPATPRPRRSPTGEADDKQFVPAIPGLPGQVVKEVTDNQDLATQRPLLSTSQRGQWRLVEFVSDGAGLLTLQAAELLRYDLASATVKSDQDISAFFGAASIVRLDESWSESLVIFLTMWIVQVVLVVIFLTALFLEMIHPGAVLPGSIAAIALVTLIAPSFLNNMANWWEIAAILVGIVCMALEILVLPGFGVFGVVGLLLLFGGLVGVFTHNSEGLFPDSPQGKNDLLHGILTLALSAVTSGVLLYFLSKHFGSIPVINRLLLRDHTETSEDAGAGLLAAMGEGGPIAAGREGVALTPLRPAGRIQIDDQIMDVVADIGFIPAGAKVRIVSVGQFRTTVERADAPTGGSSPKEAGVGEGGA